MDYLTTSLTSILPSTTNPRKQFNKDKLAELADSLKEVGVLQPLLVRPLREIKLIEPDLVNPALRLTVGGLGVDSAADKGKGEKRVRELHAKLLAERGDALYELVAGERRWRAAGLAKLFNVPVLVRPLTDQQVLEIQYIENLQRDDLTPMEEAEGFAKLIASKAYTPDTLAKKLGKSRSHIFARLALARIGGKVREALEAGKIDHTVASELASVPNQKNQEKALEYVMRFDMSFDSVRSYLADEYRQALTTAPFDRKDEALLKGVPSCEACPLRSGNLPEFDPAKKENAHICTDPACYKRKVGAHVKQLQAKFEDKGLKVLPAAEARAAFDWQDKFEPGQFVQAHDKPPGKKKSYGELLEENQAAQGYVAFNRKQKAHVVYKLAEIAPLLKEQGLTVKPPAAQRHLNYNSPEYKAQQAKEQREREAKRALQQAVSQKAIATIRAAAEAKPYDLALWRLLCEQAQESCQQQVLVEKLTEPQCRALLLEARLCRMPYDYYDGKPTQHFAAVCAHFKIDLAKLTATEQARLREETRLPKDNEEFELPKDRIEELAEQAQGGDLHTGKLNHAPFEFRSHLWVVNLRDRAGGPGQTVSISCLRVVPAEEYGDATSGTAKNPITLNHLGQRVRWTEGKAAVDYVIAKPTITLVPEKGKKK